VLNNWCAEVGRNPGEIERCCGTQKDASDAERDALLKTGVSHLILGMDEPWDFKAIEKLVKWRDSHK
jgi:hypothetical protein